MLTARQKWACAALATITASVLGMGSAHADGGGGVTCPEWVVTCTVTATGGGASGNGGSTGSGPGNTGGASSVQVCQHGGQTVPCSDAKMGWFNAADQCYWALLSPQPPDDDPAWKNADSAPAQHKPGDGQLYNVTCPFAGMELMGGTTFSATPPPGFGGAVADPAAVAQQMVTTMGLLGADIGTAPRQGGSASLVGLPVWLWDNVSDSTWGPKTASASAPGVTVTATAHVDRIIWATGDGSSVTCTGPGVKYDPSFGAQQPACGHTYTQPGTYTITGTSKWLVDWTATTGQKGQIPVDRTATATVAIAEAQAVNN